MSKLKKTDGIITLELLDICADFYHDLYGPVQQDSIFTKFQTAQQETQKSQKSFKEK